MNKVVTIKDKMYVVDFLEKDIDAEYVKWGKELLLDNLAYSMVRIIDLVKEGV
jgi:hypothetical protein